MIKQALHLSVGNLVARCAFAFLTIGVAKLVSPDRYGAFSYAIAVTTVSSYLCELGIQKTYLREVARGTPLWDDYTITSLQIRALLYAVTCGIAYLIFPLLNISQHGLRCLQLMFAPGVLGLTFTNWISGVLLSRSQFARLSINRIKAAVVQILIVGGGALVPLSNGQRIEMLALSYGIGLLAGGLLGIRLINLKKRFTHTKRFVHFSRRLLTGLQGYTLSGFLYIIGPVLGVLILERSVPLAVVGTFALAVRVPQFLYTVPAAAAQTFYPALFREARARNWSAYNALFKKESGLLFPVGISIAVLVLISSPIISVIVGHSSEHAYQMELRQALLLGAGVVFVQSLSMPLGHALETSGKTGCRTLGQCAAVATAVFAYSMLGDRYGVVGAMCAAVATELTLYFSWLILLWTTVRQVTAETGAFRGLIGGVLIATLGAGLWHFYG
jgi:O-antigen/teichoic acid export membrane protein